jgi:hypothetical protein
MREACSNARNGSHQSDHRKNIEDRLASCRPLYDFQPQLDYFATDIRKIGLGVGPQVSDLDPHTSDLGLGVGPLGRSTPLGRQLRQPGGEEAVHFGDARVRRFKI